jgi:predicted RNA-binding Zn-ribbon protein involved in translation (DUF1610 family)
VTRCEACGGTLAFDPASQALRCPACGRVEAEAEAIGSLKRARGAEFTLEALQRGARGWGTERRLLRCDGCGAEIAVEEATIATACPFCASPQVERVTAEEAAVQPGWVLPFQVRPDALVEPVRAWLGRGWMHPGSLATLARVDRFSAVYLPYWVFDARASARYRCEVGKERTVTRRGSDGRMETHTVIDWSWQEGTVDRHWKDVRVPGTSRVSARVLGRLAPGLDLGGLVPFAPGLLAGFSAQAYDVGLPAAWDQGRAVIRERTEEVCRQHAKRGGGDHVRNMSMTASLDDEVWRYVLLPFHLSAYKYADRTWVVMVDGQTGTVAGQKPVVWWRIWLVIGLMFSPAVCAGGTGLPLLLAGGVGAIPLVLAFILLVGAALGAVWLWRAATEEEAA